MYGFNSWYLYWSRDKSNSYSFNKFIAFLITFIPLSDTSLPQNRKLIVEKVSKCGQKTAYSFTPPGTSEYYPDTVVEFNPEKAKELLSISKNQTQYVGVLVKPSSEELEKFSKLNLDYFQL